MIDAHALVLPLSASSNVSLVGGKAANLARLLTAGFPVPGGFVVTAAAFRAAAVADAGGALPQRLPPDLAQAIAAAYRALGEPVVAVRSSATAEDLADASMAGQYETYLDLQGEAAVLDAVARCWRSIDTPRTRAYLASKGIALAQVAMAVVVQELVPSTVAGVLFTANPRNGRAGEMLIEASWGLGEAVVGALVQPDTLVIDRATGAVLHAVIADKRIWIEPGSHAQREVPDARRTVPCLSAAQVEELRRLGERVAAHFGSPQDLEWGIAPGGELRLLQSRAITTLDESPEGLLADERSALGAELAAGHGPWVRHNLSETLPQPTPLSWSVVKRFMSGAGGFGALYRLVGFEPAPAVCTDGFLRLVAGRVYQDLARAPEVFFAGYPFAYDLELLRANPDAAQDPPSIVTGTPGEMLGVRRRLQAVERAIDALIPTADARLVNEELPAFRAWCATERARDLSTLSVTALLDCWHARRQRVMDGFAPQSLLPSIICATVMARLKAFLDPWCWDDEPAALAELVATGGPANCTVRAAAGLRDLVEGRLPLAAWLAEHGHRAPAEFDLATPRWHERPDALRAFAANLAGGADPLALHRERVAVARAAADALRARLPRAERRTFDGLVAVLHRYLRFREDGKQWLMEGYDLLRATALEAGRRLGLGDDVFLLDETELTAALTTGYAPLALLTTRRTRRLAEARCRLPALITAAELPTLGTPPVLVGGDRLAGFPIASGSGRGPVRVVLSPDQVEGELGRGYILVCPSTDPSWTPLFVNAAGLVLERGGALSHGAVVAREMGIPAVVIDGATTLLTPGEVVAIDGDHGAVLRRLDVSAAAGPVEPAAPAADDLAIARVLLPPAVSRIERRWAHVRNVAFVLWGVVLGAAFWPGTWSTDHVYRPTLELLDRLLWPLVPVLGRPGTVLVLATVMAVLCLVLQRFCSDNARLLVAKARAARLRTLALALPADAPRRVALLRAATPVQWRIMGAAFVPLGLLLGPMIFSVFWLTDRIEALNPKPGTPIQVIAELDGEWVAPVRLDPPAGVVLNHEVSPDEQRLPSIRATLTQLERDWQHDGVPGTLHWSVGAAAAAARAGALASLHDYLARPLPSRELQWQVETPATPGRSTITLRSGDAVIASMPLTVGADLPPPATELIVRANQPAKLLQVVRPLSGPVVRVLAIVKDAQALEKPPAFLQPFARFGWHWDPGWIVFYIAVYLPAMFLVRWLLRVA